MIATKKQLAIAQKKGRKKQELRMESSINGMTKAWKSSVGFLRCHQQKFGLSPVIDFNNSITIYNYHSPSLWIHRKEFCIRRNHSKTKLALEPNKANGSISGNSKSTRGKLIIAGFSPSQITQNKPPPHPIHSMSSKQAPRHNTSL